MKANDFYRLVGDNSSPLDDVKVILEDSGGKVFDVIGVERSGDEDSGLDTLYIEVRPSV